MQILKILHKTLYRYPRPVRFGEHRLIFRPRDSHDLRLLSSRLLIEPAAEIRWIHDVFGNSIAIATFEQPSDYLQLESEIVVETFYRDRPSYDIEPWAMTLPFAYSRIEMPDLSRLIERHYPDPERLVGNWVNALRVRENAHSTADVLDAINRTIHQQLTYVSRTEEGIQTPAETLRIGSGTCRDYALLMMEACRWQGMAARFVTGYLYDPSLDGATESTVGAGSTHAWAEIYLPGAGWVQYDPTNGSAGDRNLIRVAVARDPAQAIPVQGTYYGDAMESTMDVLVKVTSRSASMAA